MPELPEVEQIRRSLMPMLIGAAIADVELRRAGVIRQAGGGRGRRERPGPRDLLADTTVVELARHGKQLAIISDRGPVLCVQLGMTGRLMIETDANEAGRVTRRHVHCVWRLRGGGRLVFEDARRFGGLTPFPSVAVLHQARWSRLGPDALTLDIEQFAASAALKDSVRSIKAALLDQQLIAGVGNIYADEALFAASIHPATRCRRLDDWRLRGLGKAIRAVLTQAVENGGTTLRDYLDARGSPGGNGQALAVYGRSGMPCLRCSQTLRKAVIAQRTTTYCDRCQRPGRSR